MEVRRQRIVAVFCTALILITPWAAQTAALTNTITVTTNAVASLSALPARPLDDQHRLRPGDKLSFRVAEDAEEAKSLLVMDSGEIELPNGFGRFVAAGKTCRSLAQEIKVALEKDYYKRASVQLGVDAHNNVRGKVYISGQVSKPGPVTIPVDAPLKLSQAILIAGPPTQWANLKMVKVVRQMGKDTQTLFVDMNAVLNEGRLQKDIALEPDDFVIVPERGLLIY